MQFEGDRGTSSAITIDDKVARRHRRFQRARPVDYAAAVQAVAVLKTSTPAPLVRFIDSRVRNVQVDSCILIFFVLRRLMFLFKLVLALCSLFLPIP